MPSDEYQKHAIGFMPEFTSDNSAKRIMKNGLFTALRFSTYALSGMFFIPFLVQEYGMGPYGLIALAGFLTQYIGLISGCIGRSVARFLNIALNQNDWHQANEIFSTAIVATLGAVIFQVPFFAVAVWKLNWIIDFPAGIGTDFRILVICNITVFSLNIMKGVFLTPIQASNRLDLNDKIEIVFQIIRLVILFILISKIGAKLWIIGVVELGIAVLIFGVVTIVSRKLVHSNLNFQRRYITTKWIKPVLNMAGWTLISVLGFAFFVKTDIWIINRFVDKEMAGIYAALLVWPNFIRQIGGQLSSLVTPVYMIDFAKDDFARMTRMCLFSNKLIGYCAAIMVAFICIFSHDILHLWLGSNFTQYSQLLKLMAVGLILTLGESVVWGVFPAINKSHYTGLANLFTGLLNILLSLVFVYAGYGVYGVAVGTLMSTILKCTIWLPYGVAKELNFPYKIFLINNVIAIILFGIIIGINTLFQVFFQAHLTVQVLAFSLSTVFTVPLLYRFGFNPADREFIQSKIRILSTSKTT